MVRSQQKHDDVLRAGIEEFAKKGCLGTTMEAIAKRAGVSKRTLYKHYPNKEALFDKVVAILLERMNTLSEVHYQPGEPVIEQLRSLADRLLRMYADKDYLTLSRIVIIESMRSKREATRLAEQFKHCEQNFHLWFEGAHQAGALKPLTPKYAAAIFFGALKKYGFWDQAIKWDPILLVKERNELINVVCDHFIQGLEKA